MVLSFEKLPNYVRYGLIAAAILALSAFIFADKFSFLQTKTQSNDSSGKCPQKCCSACSLNIWLVLLFSAGIGTVVSVAAAMLQKEHRDKLKLAVAGGTSH